MAVNDGANQHGRPTTWATMSSPDQCAADSARRRRGLEANSAPSIMAPRPDQPKWNVISVSSGIYELTSVNSGLVLDVIGGGTTNGTGGDQYTYNGNTWQQWKFTSY